MTPRTAGGAGNGKHNRGWQGPGTPQDYGVDSMLGLTWAGGGLEEYGTACRGDTASPWAPYLGNYGPPGLASTGSMDIGRLSSAAGVAVEADADGVHGPHPHLHPHTHSPAPAFQSHQPATPVLRGIPLSAERVTALLGHLPPEYDQEPGDGGAVDACEGGAMSMGAYDGPPGEHLAEVSGL